VVEAAAAGAHVRTAGHDTRAGEEICLPGRADPAEDRRARLDRAGSGRRPAPPGGRDPVDRRRARGIGEPLGPHQIHDSNGVALAAAVRRGRWRADHPAARPDDAADRSSER
jgi:hypothetical protein